MKAGTENNDRIVVESREKGYGMVHLYIVSRVSGYEMPSYTLPMPDGMALSLSPAEFMTYPKETYYPEITVFTTATTPPGDYIFLHREEWEGMYYAKRAR